MKVSWSAFDVIGPVMVGPSSSHTAGACKLGYMARSIYGVFKKVDIYLHGSFAEVYEGHATDVALLAGLMKLESHDKRIPEAFDLAADKGISYEFHMVDLGKEYHPNTAKFVFDGDASRSVTGASLGGGKVIVTHVGKVAMQVSLDYSTLIICFDKGEQHAGNFIDKVEGMGRDIVNIQTGQYKDEMIVAIEIREWFERKEMPTFEAMPGVKWVRFVNHLPNFVDLNQ